MSQRIIILLLSLFVLSFYLCVTPALSASPWDPITTALNANKSIPNAILIIGDESSSTPLYTQAKGLISINGKYNVASASKWVSSVAIMKLVEESIMSMKDSPQKYISWWTNDPADPRSRITLRLLLSQVSGFAGSQPCVGSGQYTTEACVKEMYNTGLAYAPNSTFSYGGSHFIIAGYMAMQATNKSWATIFSDQIGQSLGITSASYEPSSNPNFAGGLYITTADYLKIIQGIYSKTLVIPETIDVMQTDFTSNVTLGYTPATAFGPWHYGIGEWIECSGASFRSECLRNLTVSSPGLLGFYPWIDRHNNYYGIFSTYLSNFNLTVPFVQTLKPTIVNILQSL